MNARAMVSRARRLRGMPHGCEIFCRATTRVITCSRSRNGRPPHDCCCHQPLPFPPSAINLALVPESRRHAPKKKASVDWFSSVLFPCILNSPVYWAVCWGTCQRVSGQSFTHTFFLSKIFIFLHTNSSEPTHLLQITSEASS